MHMHKLKLIHMHKSKKRHKVNYIVCKVHMYRRISCKKVISLITHSHIMKNHI